MPVERVYLDSSIFLAHLNGHESDSRECSSILSAGESGQIDVWTSFLTMAEVSKIRSTAFGPLKDDELSVQQLFQMPFLKFVALDYVVGSLAQTIIWDHRRQARDAIHIASAVHARCSVLYSHDGGVLSLTNETHKRTVLPEFRRAEFRGATQIKFPGT